MEKQQRSVIHLEFPQGVEHRYYGNVKALCDDVPYEELGMSYSFIRNNLAKEKILRTRTGFVIRKGILVTSVRELLD